MEAALKIVTAERHDYSANHGDDRNSHLVERRSAPRMRTIFRIARIETGLDSGLCRIQNLSDSGMLLITGLDVAPDEAVTLALTDAVVVQGRVAWTDGFRVGVEFNEALDSSALLSAIGDEVRRGTHRSPRLPVNTIAIAVSETGTQIVRVLNVSQGGMKIAHDGTANVGMAIKVSLEGGIEARGVVRWSESGMAGLKLLQALSHEQLVSAMRI